MSLPSPSMPSLEEIDQEVHLANQAVTRSITHFLKSVDLISESYLAQVLIALWESGLYEYVRRNGGFRIETAAEELTLDAEILRFLTEYLLGRGLFDHDGGTFVLSERGRAYWNYITRGALTSHLGGYNSLLINLGPLLRKEIDLYDPRLDRADPTVANGAGCTLIGSDTVGFVLEAIRQREGRCVLDLGCGSGVFLTRLATLWPEGRGIGIDKRREAVEEAQGRARAYGYGDRLQFYEATLSSEPMQLAAEVVERVDLITAVFLIHEFTGRGGDRAVASILASLRAQFPGRTLLLVEGSKADPYERKTGPVRSYAQLDYSLIHPLSRQGALRTSAQWQALIESTGARVLETIPGFKLVPAWIQLYVIGL